MNNKFNRDLETMSIEDIKHEQFLEEIERTKWRRYWHAIKKDWPLYAMLIPVLLFFFIFRYMPIYGILSALKTKEFSQSLSVIHHSQGFMHLDLYWLVTIHKISGKLLEIHLPFRCMG